MRTNNHPLFPPADGDDDAPEVEQIHVTRFQGGKYVYSPYMFAPEELTSLGDIYENYGGGQYELVARADGKMSAKRRYEIAGQSRPLVKSETDEQPASHAPPLPTAALAGDTGILALVLQQGQQQAQQNLEMMRMMMQSQQTASQQMTTLLTAFMTRDSDSNKTLLQALAANNERALTAQGQVFQTMLETVGKSGGGGGINAFKEGMQLMAELGGGDEEPKDDATETLSMLVEGAKVAAGLAGGGQAPPEPLQ